MVQAVSSSGESLDTSLYLSFLDEESENSCDKFASEFLLPEPYIKPWISHSDLDFKHIRSIAAYFHTSVEATLNRCIDLFQDRYVLIVYDNYKKKYFHCSHDHMSEFMDAEIKKRYLHYIYLYMTIVIIYLSIDSYVYNIYFVKGG